MNTIQAFKKCIQIDFSEYTLFLNTLVKFEFIYQLSFVHQGNKSHRLQ